MYSTKDRRHTGFSGDYSKETMPTKAVGEFVAVDLQIPGCPVTKDEIERVVQYLV